MRNSVWGTNINSVPPPLAAIFVFTYYYTVGGPWRLFPSLGSDTSKIRSCNRVYVKNDFSVFSYNKEFPYMIELVYKEVILSLQPVLTVGTLSGKHANALEFTTFPILIFANYGVYLKLKVMNIFCFFLTISYFRNLFCSVVFIQ